MEREQESRVPAQSDPEAFLVADRLQELTVVEAERILERAIRLQTQASGSAPDLIDTEMLGRIADELDIDRSHLQQALVEELLRLDSEDPGWIDRLVVPQAIAGQGVVAGSPTAVRGVVDTWLGRHEGLRKRADDGVTTRWERDGSLVTSARMKLRMARGSGVLRGTAGVTTRVRPVTDRHQLVSVEADTSHIRRLALGMLAAAVAGGALVTAGTGAVDPGGFGMDDVIAGAGIVAVAGGGVLIGFRMWASRIKEGVGRALDAIANPGLIEDRGSLPSMIAGFLGSSQIVGRGRSGR